MSLVNNNDIDTFMLNNNIFNINSFATIFLTNKYYYELLKNNNDIICVRQFYEWQINIHKRQHVTF